MDDPAPEPSGSGAATGIEQPPDLATVLARLAVAVEAINTAAPEALGPAEAAVYCGVALSKWRDMNARALCPAPIELGDRCPRWPRRLLLAWLLAGAPSRVRWLAIQDQALRKVG